MNAAMVMNINVTRMLIWLELQHSCPPERANLKETETSRQDLCYGLINLPSKVH